MNVSSGVARRRQSQPCALSTSIVKRIGVKYKPLCRSLSLHDETRGRQHRRSAAMLPATSRAAHATRTGRALLRPRAADVDDLRRVGRTLARRPVRPVRGLGLRRPAPACFARAARLLNPERREPCGPALKDERRGRRPHQSAEQKARPEERARQSQSPAQTPAPEAPPAHAAEAPRRPHAPTRAHDPLAALAAEVRPVQDFRSPSRREDAAAGGGVSLRRHSGGTWRRTP